MKEAENTNLVCTALEADPYMTENQLLFVQRKFAASCLQEFTAQVQLQTVPNRKYSLAG